MEETRTNCRYCGTNMALTAPNCPKCGGPNEPEPKPWYLSVGNRIRAAFSAKTDSVWADRLASLMPLQFIASVIAIILTVGHQATFVVAVISIIAVFSCLVYYPGWYNFAPEQRKGSGLVHFAVTMVQLIAVYLTVVHQR